MRDMRFLDYFLYTQHSLATFDSCPLKFRKRYLENLKWSNFPDENIRRRLEMGSNFHLLAYRYFIGIESKPEEYAGEFPELELWMKSLKMNFNISPEFQYYPEYKLRMVSGEMKLEANFDLLIVKKDKIEIWDWKTHGESSKIHKGVLARKLKESLQTMVYMFVLKEQSRLVAGKEIDARNISMHYWQPEPAQTIAEIKYSNELHQRFAEVLRNKIHNILEYDFNNFNKELYSKHCKFCEFNWYCNNEKVDFRTIEENDSLMDELDWDSVEEVY